MYANVRRAGVTHHQIQYHEQKVLQHKAECLLAENFIKRTIDLTEHDKLYHIERLSSLRTNGSRNNLDISLNFHPKDSITDPDMRLIAQAYMKRLGLDGQPWLLYRHHDSGHTHAHIVVTLIQNDGQRIDFSPKRLHESNKVCRELESRFSLIVFKQGMSPAERQSDRAQRVLYSQQPTVPALSNVINRAIPQYKYTSMDELNAVLRLYNVEAYRGKPDSYLYQHRGLLYRVLDERGNVTGTSVKASIFDSKPTLVQLEKKFVLNQAEAERPQNKMRIRTAVDLAFRKDALDLSGLQQKLEKEQISLVMLKDRVGGGTKSYFVDHLNRTVYAGKDLGDGYDRQALEQRYVPTEKLKEMEAQKLIQQHNQRRDQRENISKHLL